MRHIRIRYHTVKTINHAATGADASRLRKRANIPITAMAKSMGTVPSVLSKLENGATAWTPSWLVQYNTALQALAPEFKHHTLYHRYA